MDLITALGFSCAWEIEPYSVFRIKNVRRHINAIKSSVSLVSINNNHHRRHLPDYRIDNSTCHETPDDNL